MQTLAVLLLANGRQFLARSDLVACLNEKQAVEV